MNSLAERKTRIRETRYRRQRHELAMAVSADRRRSYRILFFLLAIATSLAVLIVR